MFKIVSLSKASLSSLLGFFVAAFLQLLNKSCESPGLRRDASVHATASPASPLRLEWKQ